MTRVQRLLASRGVTFDNSFVSFSLCCPSRATFLTGQYAHNHGVLANGPPSGGVEKLDASNTLAVWLQHAGYYTAFVGKYLNGYGRRTPQTVIPPGWDAWYASVNLSFLGGSMNDNGNLITFSTAEADYQTDVFSRIAQNVIRRRAPLAQPLFLWVTPHAPHTGGPRDPDDPADGFETTRPAARHRDRFASVPLPMPASFNEEDVSDKPADLRSRPPLTPTQIADIREAHQQQLESLLAVDEMVGAIVDRLQEAGELDNTVVLFTSDNGFLNGEHRIRLGKVLPYEPSIRVPLIVSGPDIPVGLHLRQMVANIDLAPTIVALAGAKPDRVMDGRSLVPLFRDPGIEWGRDLLLEGLADDPVSLRFTGVRTPRFLYVEYGAGERELYDLADDPNELLSRHDDPAYASMRDELARRLAGLRTCAGVGCRQGPQLALSVRCRGPRPEARLEGPDQRLVVRVEFLVRGGRVGVDNRAPFARVLPSGKRSVRALAVLDDGRRVTRDRRAPSCRG